MAKLKNKFVCRSCGYESAKWMGKCSNCNEWNSFEEIVEAASKKNDVRLNTNRKLVKKLSEIESGNSDRIITNINEFNRVMGGGIVKDSITIISAKPGAGKSTLLLQIANDIAHKGLRVLYASGEESDSQLKSRAERILKEINENIWILSDTSMDNVVEYINEINPDLIIIDSIQVFTLEECMPSRAGSPTQTMECANKLLSIAKNIERPRAVILVGQMNKNEEIAGLRALEHLVDTVLIIDGENEEELRALQSTKNRFGGTGEIGFFEMSENGMLSIDNPSEYFITMRENDDAVSGSALSVAREGSRPIIVEIESLVSSSFAPYPSRIGENLGKDQLNTLISILEQRGKINLFNKNVVIKITGGLKIKEQAINLSVIMSIVSSVYNKGIPNDIVFIADVGLTGELKKVPSLETRIKELDRMGYKKVYTAKNSFNRPVKFNNITVVECNNLSEVMLSVFGKLKSTD